MYLSYTTFKRIGLCLFILACSSCKKFIEVDVPRTQMVRSTVFESDATATSSLVSIYPIWSGTLSTDLIVYSGLTGDELENYRSDFSPQIELASNNILTANSSNARFWASSYEIIFLANTVLEGLGRKNGVSAPVKKQLSGEAFFARAFWHFYLTNLYGDVPIVTTTDHRVTAIAPRSPQAKVYEQVTADLDSAEALLTADYVGGSNEVVQERVRPNIWTVRAFRARVHLYRGNWDEAIQYSTALIGQKQLYDTVALNDVFLKNSKESIWQIIPQGTTSNTNEGIALIIPSGKPSSIALRKNFADGFEAGDGRRSNWVGNVTSDGETYYYAYKYKIRASTVMIEYSMVLRLGEQYLIRAEAYANKGNIISAVADLNVIRKRSQLPPLSGTLTKEACLLAIEKERRAELFCEWAHRWLDLKRTGRVDAVIQSIKPNFRHTDQLWPIPHNDRLANPFLTQNEGYQ